MTNLEKFFSSSSGVIFLFIYFLCSMTTESFREIVLGYMQPLLDGERAQLLSFTALLIVLLGFSSVALSLVIGRFWDLTFYLFGHGYDREEYEPVRQALQNSTKEGSEVSQFLLSLRIQPIYGTILHSYAPTSYIEWLGRRWTSFNNSGLQATAAVLAVLATLVQSCYLNTNLPSSALIIVFLLVFPAVTMFVGYARLREVLSSEALFCRSLLEEELSDAMNNVSKKITERGGSTEGVPSLGARL